MTTKKPTRRQAFGSVRKLPSGRWQARYPDPAGRPMTAPSTFATKRDALDHIAAVRADRSRGVYLDHRDGAEPFGDYARKWIANGGRRGHLAERTRELYSDLLARDLATFDAVPVSAITPRAVRDWYAAHGRETAKRSTNATRPGATRLRQAYALLKAIMATAVDDRMIGSNPCKISGAGVASSPERPYLDPATLAKIVAAMPAHYATPIRLAFAAHLRLGELLGLQRGDFDETAGTLLVERQAIVIDKATTYTPTKTGQARTVALPPSAVTMMAEHMKERNGAARFPRSLMFTRPDGQPITRHAIQQAWKKAAKKVGAEQFHLHDVRHAGLTLAAQSGATTRELMSRAGHRTAAASMTYQHVAAERNSIIAARMDALANGAILGITGTSMARDALPAAAEASAEPNENRL